MSVGLERRLIEIRNAVRHREIHRLKLNEKLILIEHRKEKCYDDFVTELRSYQQKLQEEDFKSKVRVEGLSTRINSLQQDYEAMERHTARFLAFKKQRDLEGSIMKMINENKKTCNVFQQNLNTRPSTFPDFDYKQQCLEQSRQSSISSGHIYSEFKSTTDFIPPTLQKDLVHPNFNSSLHNISPKTSTASQYNNHNLEMDSWNLRTVSNQPNTMKQDSQKLSSLTQKDDEQPSKPWERLPKSSNSSLHSQGSIKFTSDVPTTTKLMVEYGSELTNEIDLPTRTIFSRETQEENKFYDNNNDLQLESSSRSSSSVSDDKDSPAITPKQSSLGLNSSDFSSQGSEFQLKSTEFNINSRNLNKKIPVNDTKEKISVLEKLDSKDHEDAKLYGTNTKESEIVKNTNLEEKEASVKSLMSLPATEPSTSHYDAPSRSPKVKENVMEKINSQTVTHSNKSADNSLTNSTPTVISDQNPKLSNKKKSPELVKEVSPVKEKSSSINNSPKNVMSENNGTESKTAERKELLVSDTLEIVASDNLTQRQTPPKQSNLSQKPKARGPSSKASFEKEDSSSDDDFFAENIPPPVRRTSAYQRMVGFGSSTPTKSTKTDLHYDTESLDSVEAAIQASVAAQKSAMGKSNTQEESDEVSNTDEISHQESLLKPSKLTTPDKDLPKPTSKPSAISINLDTDSESYAVSVGGASENDDEGFEF